MLIVSLASKTMYRVGLSRLVYPVPHDVIAKPYPNGSPSNIEIKF
jgi:hypothetical protein